ncbi:cell division protein ZipA C-terminal FtsZ-binding domain-containing protein [Halomonas sp. Bachu 37]|uniref:cell division protein ZipA C-terminal FtsZ-binding domain-containing protein n=1 Tax=Halomonas kashgarensis TaxID=3084920 RepID=UPI00321708CF
MNETTLATWLAGVALLLGLVSLSVVGVVLARRRANAAEKPAEPQEKAPPVEAIAPVAPRREKTKQKPKTQQCLFVVFDSPGQQANQALGNLLQARNAFYEAELGVYHLPPSPEGYPLMVANSAPPGKLPPLHADEEQPPVQGVSILIRFLNTRRVSRNPEALIDFTHEVADIGGHILDADRQPVTEETFDALRREAG